MNKALIIAALIVLAGVTAFAFMNNEKPANTNDNDITSSQSGTMNTQSIEITPIEHASAVLTLGGAVIYTDPVGGAEMYAGQGAPDIILLTDIHGDHLDVETLNALVTDSTMLIAPQAVVDELPENLTAQTRVMKNGESIDVGGFRIEAIPMYNLPESDDAYHTKGRGNGYVLEKDGTRVYVAGDTQGIPEMRALKNIDVAFVPMNLPFTMDVDEAADAVLAFKPKKVYPYHFRGRDGKSDVILFKQLVDAGGEDIEVVLLDWYPNDGE